MGDSNMEMAADRLLEPLRSHRDTSALLLDVDGTLAPIVATPDQAAVPQATRETLAALAESYAFVACISGRRVLDARRVVGIESIGYSGNHGFEYLAPHSDQVQLDTRAEAKAKAVRGFAAERFTSELEQAGIRFEDKRTICAFHWRGASDPVGARAMLEQLATEARKRGLIAHWGRLVLEIRPDVKIDKGSAVEAVLGHSGAERALYAGDDTTDLDAFRKLQELRRAGTLVAAACVGVTSDESPPQIAAEADLTVPGPAGLAELLTELAP